MTRIETEIFKELQHAGLVHINYIRPIRKFMSKKFLQLSKFIYPWAGEWEI